MAEALTERQIGALKELQRRGKLDERRSAALDEIERRRGNTPAFTPEVSREEKVRMAGERAGSEAGPLRAAALNVGEGVFGLGSRLSARIDQAREFAGSVLGDGEDKFTYDEHLAFRRAEAEAAADENPISGTGAYLAGALTGGAGAAKLATKVAPRVAAALAPKVGQTGRNIGRIAAAGAAGGAGQAAGEGEILSTDPIEGAAIGAVAAPAVAGIARGTMDLLRRAGVALGVPVSIESAAFKRLVKGLMRPDETLPQTHARVRQSARNLEKTLGRRPAAHELVEEVQPSVIKSAVETSPTATRTARELAQTSEQGLPTSLAARQAANKPGAGVLGSRIAPTPAALTQRAGKEFGASIERIGDQQVPVTPELRQALTEPAVTKAIVGRDTGQYSQRVRKALENDDIESLSVRDIQTMRKRLGDRILGKTDYDEGIPEMRAAHDLITETAERGADGNLTEYGRTLRNFNWRKSMAEGFAEGQKILNEGDPAAFRSLYEAANLATQTGMRFGARSRVRGMIGESSKGLEDDLRRIARDPGLHERLSTVLRPQEIQDMIRAADIGHKLFLARATSTPSTVRDRNRMAEMVRTGLEAGIMAKVGAGGAFLTGAISRAAGRLRVGEKEARRLAEMAYDPAQLPAVLEQLAKHGMTPKMWRSELNAAFRTLPGQLTGSEVAGGE